MRGLRGFWRKTYFQARWSIRRTNSNVATQPMQKALSAESQPDQTHASSVPNTVQIAAKTMMTVRPLMSEIIP